MSLEWADLEPATPESSIFKWHRNCTLQHVLALSLDWKLPDHNQRKPGVNTLPWQNFSRMQLFSLALNRRKYSSLSLMCWFFYILKFSRMICMAAENKQHFGVKSYASSAINLILKKLQMLMRNYAKLSFLIKFH